MGLIIGTAGGRPGTPPEGCGVLGTYIGTAPGEGYGTYCGAYGGAIGRISGFCGWGPPMGIHIGWPYGDGGPFSTIGRGAGLGAIWGG